MPDAILHNGGMECFLILFLFSAHVISDFLVQSSRVAREKEEHVQVLLLHGILTLLTTLVITIPFWGRKLLPGIVVLAVFHTAIDWWKARTEPRWKETLATFLADQALHGISVVIVWLILVRVGATDELWFAIPVDWFEPATIVLVVAAGFVFNGKGGTAIVRKLLERYPDVLPDREGKDAAAYSMGRMIGDLERFITYTLVLLGQWGALGFIIAAKSIARFRELERQSFADYYLIGTLSSLLVAIVTGIVVSGLIR